MEQLGGIQSRLYTRARCNSCALARLAHLNQLLLTKSGSFADLTVFVALTANSPALAAPCAQERGTTQTLEIPALLKPRQHSNRIQRLPLVAD